MSQGDEPIPADSATSSDFAWAPTALPDLFPAPDRLGRLDVEDLPPGYLLPSSTARICPMDVEFGTRSARIGVLAQMRELWYETSLDLVGPARAIRRYQPPVPPLPCAISRDCLVD